VEPVSRGGFTSEAITKGGTFTKDKLFVKHSEELMLNLEGVYWNGLPESLNCIFGEGGTPPVGFSAVPFADRCDQSGSIFCRQHSDRGCCGWNSHFGGLFGRGFRGRRRRSTERR
jgi:hypothetical protein